MRDIKSELVVFGLLIFGTVQYFGALPGLIVGSGIILTALLTGRFLERVDAILNK